MMRKMRPGMPVYPVKSEEPGTMRAVRVGDGLFRVNLASHPVAITVEGLRFRMKPEPPKPRR